METKRKLTIHEKINLKKLFLIIRDSAFTRCVQGGTIKELSATLGAINKSCKDILGYKISL